MTIIITTLTITVSETKSMESVMAESLIGLRKFPMMTFFKRTDGITQNLQPHIHIYDNNNKRLRTFGKICSGNTRS